MIEERQRLKFALPAIAGFGGADGNDVSVCFS
jgi:hypothetical protein